MTKKVVIKPRATTFRIEPDVQRRLSILAKSLKRPLNQLVNDAVKTYVDRRSKELEDDLEATLSKLRAYRESDPDFERAIAAFAEAEVNLEDPLEGQRMEERGPVQTKVYDLLNG